MAQRKPPSKGLLEKSEDVALFGMCTDCVVIAVNHNLTTAASIQNLAQEVFQQSKGLGGKNVDPVDGSGLVHLIWGMDYAISLDNLAPSGSINAAISAFISRNRDTQGGIEPTSTVEQEFSNIIHGCDLSYNTCAIATGIDSWGINGKSYMFKQPYVAINPYYFDAVARGLVNAGTCTIGYKLSCYVYYQLKRVDHRVYNYLNEKYGTGAGGMKSRAREIKVSGEV